MRSQECSKERARLLIAPVLQAKSNPENLTIDDLIQGRCFQVTDDSGQEIGGYVLRGIDSEIWIQAGAGRAGVDLCDLYEDLILRHGAGFKTIAFKTHRRGLVKKALQRGYKVENLQMGFILRKEIK